LAITIRKPVKDDAKQIFKLVKGTNVLDVNSEYLYLLQSTHFSEYCSVATVDSKIVGFTSGYIVPDKPDTLFIWQVAVDSSTRGQGVAQKLIIDILERKALEGIKVIHTTISPSNTASQRLFEKLSEHYGASFTKEVMFEVSDFNDAHEDEVLYKIQLKK
jgi:L-2,4-diaminobutyric acid acetyltransferase